MRGSEFAARWTNQPHSEGRLGCNRWHLGVVQHGHEAVSQESLTQLKELNSINLEECQQASQGG